MSGPVLCTWCHQDCAVVSRYGHLCEKCHEGLHPTPPQPTKWELEAEEAFQGRGGGLEDSARNPGVGLSGPLSRYRERVREIPDPREEE